MPHLTNHNKRLWAQAFHQCDPVFRVQPALTSCTIWWSAAGASFLSSGRPSWKSRRVWKRSLETREKTLLINCWNGWTSTLRIWNKKSPTKHSSFWMKKLERIAYSASCCRSTVTSYHFNLIHFSVNFCKRTDINAADLAPWNKDWIKQD